MKCLKFIAAFVDAAINHEQVEHETKRAGYRHDSRPSGIWQDYTCSNAFGSNADSQLG
ncbi:protein of unknown function (plasmid) [Cupriavidus taiwanensis]|uniref:Uncharacterized protein n=1 Tax=Cupriavidus taiwanensis TaxID=164546 RepID=A0A375FIA3_9BURK|nr:protein of unknown function [Cupriavidus taiwanensis]SOZ72440.1 protein of unknown function [Cupriavidus taiwanensis]SOZ74835.1 protein of unknown function [Cupriavidus taiwanensis]SPA03643.1 protein of unknown function [Cupriavidus taiwanensis]SPA11540.1 protein of unknown function [Cupriavidus taiwanensis]